jgi:FRG domain
MAYPVDYWQTYERSVNTLADLVDVVTRLSAGWPDRRFVWRGVSNADYALHSSLYRRLFSAGRQDETDLFDVESEILKEARRWALQRTATDRLSALELLAALQHQWTPTRLLDFSHNPLVAFWFAAEQKYDIYGRPLPDIDGRVFVAQSNGREIPNGWEHDLDLPWRTPPADWSSDIYVWTPPPIDGRMARQQGCFVIGGVPSNRGGWSRSPRTPGSMTQTEIRQSVSVPVRLNSPNKLNGPTRGPRPRYPLAFTFRIPAAVKPRLRDELTRGFGYDHAMLYPDQAGFARFADSIRALP